MNGVPVSIYVRAVLAHLFWAGNAVAASGSLERLGPWTINASRWTIALALMLPLLLYRREGWPALTRREWILLIIAGASGIFLFNTFMYMALERSTAINNALIYGTAPMIILVLSMMYLGERTQPIQWLGACISLLGIAWIVTEGSLEVLRSLEINRGDLFTLAAAFMWAIYSVVGKKLSARLSSLQSVVGASILGLMALWPMAWIEAGGFPLANVTGRIGLDLLYLGIFASVLAFLFWVQVVDRLGGTRAAPFSNLFPVFGVLLSVLFLDERLLLSQTIGGLLVIAGIFLVVRPRPEPAIALERGTG